MDYPQNAMFTRSEAAAISGVPEANLEYWNRIGILPPGAWRAKKRGSNHFYNFRDVLAMRIIRDLRDTMRELAVLKPAVEFVRTDERLDLGLIDRSPTLYIIVINGACGGSWSRPDETGEDGTIHIVEPETFGDEAAMSAPIISNRGARSDIPVFGVFFVNLFEIVTDLNERIAAMEAADQARATAAA